MLFPFLLLLPCTKKIHCVKILSTDFEETIELELLNNKYFYTVLNLPTGIYRYQLEADGEIITDPFRSPHGGLSELIVGEYNNGIIFDPTKILRFEDKLIIQIALYKHQWNKINLNIQSLLTLNTIPGIFSFCEGSHNYYEFHIPTQQIHNNIIFYFELVKDGQRYFFGESGLKNQEWEVHPIEINITKTIPTTYPDITAIYNISSTPSSQKFDQHLSYFDDFPISHITGSKEESPFINEKFPHIASSNNSIAENTTALLHYIFLQNTHIDLGIGLFQKMMYELNNHSTTIPIALSNHNQCFWSLSEQNIDTALPGIIFQMLGCNIPEILFGEETGLSTTGLQRQMYWSKNKINTDLFTFYKKLLKLRQQYPVLRKGHSRFCIQEKQAWGLERYLQGEDSIFIFANHSKENITIDLTEIMQHNGNMIELISDHKLKRKKVCTIFAQSAAVYKKIP
ncbi:MAG: hypothetical protein ACRCTQ_00785 [Brevinemataceae bacterium]